MAQRTLKIALASSISNPNADVTIWFDNQIIENDLAVTNSIDNPLIIEHSFEAGSQHTLKIKMNNDYFEESAADLNLIISYLMLSNEDGSYTPYTYVIRSLIENDNYRSEDNLYLITETLWNADSVFELVFDVNNLTTWYDSYQYNIDHPSQ